MKLNGVDSLKLYSDLSNNAGITRLFNQTKTKKDIFHKVHINDYKQVRGFLQKAIELNPDNCVAKHNLKMIETVLKIPKDSISDNGQYLYKEWLEQQDFDSCDCKIPPPPPHQEILTRLNKEKEVVFILDVSGSMSISTPDGRTRFQAMKGLVLDLIRDLDEDVKIGVITLGQNCSNQPLLKYDVGVLSRDELSNKVESLQLNGSTPLNNRLKQAQGLFTKDKNEKAIFLCSDGLNTCDTRESTCQIGDSYKRKNITIYAFSLLLDDDINSAEYAIYDCITRATYGELLGISQTEEIEVNTKYISTAVFPLVLKREDLVEGKFHFLDLEVLLGGYDAL
jgi:hypothetical protein